jgi:hypothetical protein
MLGFYHDLDTYHASLAENLNVLATEVREHIRSKAGMTAFSRVWEELRKKTVAKRGGRRRERDDLVR